MKSGAKFVCRLECFLPRGYKGRCSGQSCEIVDDDEFIDTGNIGGHVTQMYTIRWSAETRRTDSTFPQSRTPSYNSRYVPPIHPSYTNPPIQYRQHPGIH